MSDEKGVHNKDAYRFSFGQVHSSVALACNVENVSTDDSYRGAEFRVPGQDGNLSAIFIHPFSKRPPLATFPIVIDTRIAPIAELVEHDDRSGHDAGIERGERVFRAAVDIAIYMNEACGAGMCGEPLVEGILEKSFYQPDIGMDIGQFFQGKMAFSVGVAFFCADPILGQALERIESPKGQAGKFFGQRIYGPSLPDAEFHDQTAGDFACPERPDQFPHAIVEDFGVTQEIIYAQVAGSLCGQRATPKKSFHTLSQCGHSAVSCHRGLFLGVMLRSEKRPLPEDYPDFAPGK